MINSHVPGQNLKPAHGHEGLVILLASSRGLANRKMGAWLI